MVAADLSGDPDLLDWPPRWREQVTTELDEQKEERFEFVREPSARAPGAWSGPSTTWTPRPGHVRPRLLRRPADPPEGPDHRAAAHPLGVRRQRDHLQPGHQVPAGPRTSLVEFDGITEFQWWLLSEAALERMMQRRGLRPGRRGRVVRAAGHRRRRLEGAARHRPGLRLKAPRAFHAVSRAAVRTARPWDRLSYIIRALPAGIERAAGRIWRFRPAAACWTSAAPTALPAPGPGGAEYVPADLPGNPDAAVGSVPMAGCRWRTPGSTRCCRPRSWST